MSEITIVVIDTLDHYHTDDGHKKCILRRMGELIEETDDYVRFAMMGHTFDEKMHVERLMNVMKCAIIQRQDFVIDMKIGKSDGWVE